MKNKILISVCICIFLIGVIGSVFVLTRHRGTEVRIVRDGSVLYSFDLAAAKDQTFDIEYKGSVNTIQIEDGKIRVLKADCPDNTCVHMGWLESGSLPIVCLPNHLIIQFADAEGDVDAVSR